MSDTALVLGPILFRDFEIPSRINFGGRQRLVAHQLPGGRRVIDALGRDDAQISFAGTFTGANATLRARTLDELRIAGSALQLTWDVFFYTILIADFRADYRRGWWIPYQIVCSVVQDEASISSEFLGSLATATNDVNVAANYASSAGSDLSKLRMAVEAPGATTRGTLAFTNVQVCLAAAQLSIDSSIDVADDLVRNVDLANAGSARAATTNLLTATTTMGQVSSLAIANSYIGRVATNLVEIDA